MNGNASMAFRPAHDDDVDFLYQLHAATMKEYVDKTWGWGEEFQKAMFRMNYAPAGVLIITLDGRDIGMLSVEERQADIYLRAIEILPQYQNKGIGTDIT